jgi:PPM family protein phosphatase
MNISIYPPQSLNEQGKRSNNEDSIFPNPLAKSNSNVFLVCDGVGGEPCGEHASRIVATSFSDYFKNKQVSDVEDVLTAISLTEKAMQQFGEQHKEARKMASTMTFLHLHQKGATIAHIGDSRVYHFRNGKILFKTADHSWVNEMVKAGVLDLETALTHAYRNVVTRVVQCNHQGAQPETELISDIQAEDLFFLCSDGILESLTDMQLEFIMGDKMDDKEKIETIQEACKERSKDNFSCYLIRIRSTNAPVEPSSLADMTDPLPPKIGDDFQTDPEGAGLMAKAVWVLLGISLIAMLFTVLNQK